MVPRSTRSYWNEFFYVWGGNKVENELLKIKDEALEKIEACSSLKELNDIRVLYLSLIHILIDWIFLEDDN